MRIKMLSVLTLPAVVVACAAGHEPTSPLRAASLTISAGGQTAIVVQQTLQLTASVRDSSGASLAGQGAVWTSSDSTIATVSSSGLVNGKRPGIVLITAASGTATQAITLTVVPPIAQVTVSAEQNGSVAVGGLAYVEVTAFDASGDTISGLPISWSSSNTLTAAIAQSTPAFRGVVTAAAPGSATISATVDGVSGSTLMTIVPLSAIASLTVRPSTVTFVAGPLGFTSNSQITATALDASGNAVLGAPVSWTISDPTAATVSSAGLITPNPAVASGSMVKATVMATVAGLSTSVPIIVCPAVMSIAVSTTAISLQVGQSVVVAATALDAHGNLELAPLASETVYPSGIIASIDRAGFDSLRVTGTAPGTASLHFHDNVGGAQSQTISISVGGAALSMESAASRRRPLISRTSRSRM